MIVETMIFFQRVAGQQKNILLDQKPVTAHTLLSRSNTPVSTLQAQAG
ncbi:MAG: hypothetical protein ACREDP_19505 [Bradyrhizobium sp.]